MQIYTVGRDNPTTPLDIRIPRENDTVGRIHLEVSCLDDGRYYIVDQGTVNKTWVNHGQGWQEVKETYLDINTPIRLGAYQTSVGGLLASLQPVGNMAPAYSAPEPLRDVTPPASNDGDWDQTRYTPGSISSPSSGSAGGYSPAPYQPEPSQPASYQPAPYHPEPVDQFSNQAAAGVAVPNPQQIVINNVNHYPAEHQNARPLGTIRENSSVILLSIFTFGIYLIFWMYESFSSVRRYRGQGWSGSQCLLFTLVPILNIVGFAIPWLLPSYVGKMYQEDGKPAPITGLSGWWIFVPIIGSYLWLYYVNSALNEFWRSKGAR
ncbi:MAG: FHA domain-containing protein [Akkermansiaceae bacterium]